VKGSPRLWILAGITTFFNPGRHQNKVDNFRKFRASVSAQGLQMLCVELVFGDHTPFQLRGSHEGDGASMDGAAGEAHGEADGKQLLPPHETDCDMLIHRRTSSGNTLWQKERLLNIALDNLPRTIDKVMWLDSDLIWLNDDWVVETSELLDRFPVVQPFGWMTYMSADQDGSNFVETLGSLPLGQVWLVSPGCRRERLPTPQQAWQHTLPRRPRRRSHLQVNSRFPGRRRHLSRRRPRSTVLSRHGVPLQFSAWPPRICLGRAA